MSTFLHGVGSVQFLDKSAEVVDIKGLDVSSLPKMGVINYEHKNDVPAQLVGKITKAKKIFSKEECSNEHELHFWNKVKVPYLYIMAELLDDYCDSAKHVAGILKYDRDRKDQNQFAIMWFSVEGSEIPGSRANKQTVSRGIARKVTLTAAPCNQGCAVEILEEQKSQVHDDFESLFKSEEEAITLFKSGEGTKIYEDFLAKKEHDKGHKLGQTNSGKDVFSHGKIADYDFSPSEHKEAAEHHRHAFSTAEDKKDQEHHFERMRLHNGAAITGTRMQNKRSLELENRKKDALEGKKLMDKSELAKAKVDEGKSPEEKVKARDSRHLRVDWDEAPASVKSGRKVEGIVHQQKAPASEGYVKLQEKGVHHPFAIDKPKGQGTSAAGSFSEMGEKDRAKKAHSKVSSQMKQIKPNLPKSESMENDLHKATTGKNGKRSDISGHEKGVHLPVRDLAGKQQGMSTMGTHVREPDSIGHGSKEMARRHAQSNLKDLKDLPKPNLGKSEWSKMNGTDPHIHSWKHSKGKDILTLDTKQKKIFHNGANAKNYLDNKHALKLLNDHINEIKKSSKLNESEQELKKALEAGSTNAAPSTLVNGAAYQVEQLGTKKKKNWNEQAKSDYENWPHREKFEKFLQARMPHLALGEIQAIGRTIALKKSIEMEKSLESLVGLEKSDKKHHAVIHWPSGETHHTHARKMGGTWLIGGDHLKATTDLGGKVNIHKDGKIYHLMGNRMKFQDNQTDEQKEHTKKFEEEHNPKK